MLACCVLFGPQCSQVADQAPNTGTPVVDSSDNHDAPSTSTICSAQRLGITTFAFDALLPLVACEFLDVAPSEKFATFGCKRNTPPQNVDVLTIVGIDQTALIPAATTETFVYGSNGPAHWLDDDLLQCGWAHCLRIGSKGVGWNVAVGHGLPMNHLDAPGITADKKEIVVPHATRLTANLLNGISDYNQVPKGIALTDVAVATSLDATTGTILETWALPPAIAAAESAGTRSRLRLMWARPLPDGGTWFAGSAAHVPINPNDSCPVVGVANSATSWRWFRYLEDSGDCGPPAVAKESRVTGTDLLASNTAIVLTHRPVSNHQTSSLELMAIDVANGTTKWRRVLDEYVRTPDGLALPGSYDIRAGTLWTAQDGRIFVGRIPAGDSVDYAAKPKLAMRVDWFDSQGNQLGQWESTSMPTNQELGAGSLRTTPCGIRVVWGGQFHQLDNWGHASVEAAGKCAELAYVDCQDTNPCTNDLCDPKLGCVHPTFADGAACSVQGVCKAGVCVEP